MKEAFLMGILAMSANADDGDINVKQIVTPVTVSQNGKDVTYLKKQYVYAVTANDTRAAIPPQVTRHITVPN